MSVPENGAQEGLAKAQTPTFTMQKIYLKDVSFESPGAPEVFMREWKPKADLRFDNKANQVSEGIFEVGITATVTVSVEEKTAYLIEATQCGLFQIAGFSDEELKAQLATTCPAILFPYLREEVSSLAGKGGFPQMLLAPMNFDALYEQHVTQSTKT